tara:strand:+ start:2838 stop:4925 length:2088 start_codon:yes stop_codon:yes gene_type:complete
MNNNILNQKIEFIKGVGPQKARLLNSEVGIYTLYDLVQYFPFRYEDRSNIQKLADICEESVEGVFLVTVLSKKITKKFKAKNLKVKVKDASGYAELVWLKGVDWIEDKIIIGKKYLIFGKPKIYKKNISFVHPETNEHKNTTLGIRPVYPTTEKLKRGFVNNRFFNKIIDGVLLKTIPYIKENLSEEIIKKAGLVSRVVALKNIHTPENKRLIIEAKKRLKFEELFFLQLQILQLKKSRLKAFPGYVFKQNTLLNKFYKKHMPFELTNAQKKVIKECYENMCSGKQMNRLVQGDVGSGKTIVAFLCMLFPIESEAQVAFMAPTEVLAEQHFKSILSQAEKLNLKVGLLTGSTKKKDRDLLLKRLVEGKINVLIGTHALIEKRVKFKKLGLVVIDEQHKFGVAQRAKLWSKKEKYYPHVLVMTATPIPRTLALTLYGDLDVSVIDELPKGRKKIITSHRNDNSRLKVLNFIKQTVESGSQVYVVYPLIEESAKKDHKDLMDGYDSLKRYFPNLQVGVLHGRMKSENKDYEMRRFQEGKSKVLVSTTVVEVGVDVPNASVIIIESAERFGLSQLHQLRGRVGRGEKQSYCILMTKYDLSKESKERIKAMVDSSDGFKIANTDLKLRGPGNMMGTKQSGLLELRFTNLAEDYESIKNTRELAKELIKKDPDLKNSKNEKIKKHLKTNIKSNINWSRIS